MAYVVPAVQISQEFNQLPVFTESPLSALIIGPHLPPIGYITGIAVGTAGSGYTTAPTVTITDPTGSGAAANAVINSAGAVTSFVVTSGGTSYTSPTITLSAPPGTATANAVLSGTTLGSVSITNIGSGYTSAPTITISGGGGSGATATASLTNGYVTGITVTAAGTGYTSTPTITIASPGTEVQAVAGAVSFAGGTVSTITVTAGGTGYTSAPTVVFTGGSGTGATATATESGGAITGISITNGGSGYITPPTISFTGGGGTGAAAVVTLARTELQTPYSLYGTIGTVSQPSDIINAFGDTNEANTIAYGLLQAVNNSNGATVYYGVTTPVTTGVTEEDAYDNVLNLAQKSSNFYGLVPLTFNTAVQQDFVAHVNAMSSPGNAKWRVTWLCNQISSSGNTASQIAGYLAGLFSGTISEGSSGNPNSGPRRVRNVFPSSYTDANGLTVNGYFAAAALAGLRSGSVPHQSLTNTQVIGPVAVPLVTQTYTVTQLNQLAAAGVWILTQDATGGTVYTRQQLTGDSSSLNYREDSVTANVDSVSYSLQSALAPFIGIYNISPSALLTIKTAVDTELRYLLNNTYTTRAGNQLLGYEIVSIAQDPTFQDRVNVTVTLTVPYPVNNISVTLSI